MDSTRDKSSNEVAVKASVNSKAGFIFFLYNLATFVEYFNLQFLHSSMRGLEKSLGLRPQQLTLLSLVEELSLVSFIPVWGFMSDYCDIKYILTSALAISGISSISLGLVSNYQLMVLIRIINGATIGSILPCTQTFIANNMESNLGFAFGVNHSITCIARLMCSLVITTYASEILLGMDGWRVCSVAFGVFSVGCSFFMLLIPGSCNKKYKDQSNKSLSSRIKNVIIYVYENIRETFVTATSKLLLLVVFFSDAPFVAAGFMIMFLQYSGMSSLQSAITFSFILLGGIFGGVFGGITTDYFHRSSPRYGRLLYSSLYVVVRIATFVVLFFFMGDYVSNKWFITFMVFINGVTYITVNVIDRSILVDVVLPKFSGSSIALCRCIAGIASSLVFNPILGALTELVFGYKPSMLDMELVPIQIKELNTKSLRYSLSILVVSSSLMCLVLYSVMCLTFDKDSHWISQRSEESSVKVNMECVNKDQVNSV